MGTTAKGGGDSPTLFFVKNTLSVVCFVVYGLLGTGWVMTSPKKGRSNASSAVVPGVISAAGGFLQDHLVCEVGIDGLAKKYGTAIGTVIILLS